MRSGATPNATASTSCRSDGASARTSVRRSTCGSGPGARVCSTSARPRRRRGCCAPSAAGARPPGATYAWLVDSTTMVNHFYFYVVDDDFGPFFLKFCSYFPYNAKLCINGHEYLKRQLAKRGIGFEPLDNGILRCADPEAMQRPADGLTAERIDAPCSRSLDENGCGSHAAGRIRPHRGLRPAACRTGLLRGSDAREPRHGPTRPRAVDLQPARQPTHSHAASHPRDYRRGHPVAACGLQALAHQAVLGCRRDPCSVHTGFRDLDSKLHAVVSHSDRIALCRLRLANPRPPDGSAP